MVDTYNFGSVYICLLVNPSVPCVFYLVHYVGLCPVMMVCPWHIPLFVY